VLLTMPRAVVVNARMPEGRSVMRVTCMTGVSAAEDGDIVARDVPSLKLATMQLHRVRLGWITWVASLAILLSALAPTVSRWLATSRAAFLPSMEVCVTREGLPSILVFKQAPDDSPGKMKMDHCPLCVLHADHLGLPPASLTMAHMVFPKGTVPALFLNAPTPLHVWATAQARAPPVVLV
jgi:hypothetical protein